jgi:GT2 family glycosyltransferase
LEPVCIIIVTYNAEKWLSKSVDKLIDIPEGCKLIVVDNCSKDETCEILRTKYPNLHLISSAKNLGFGQANN